MTIVSVAKRNPLSSSRRRRGRPRLKARRRPLAAFVHARLAELVARRARATGSTVSRVVEELLQEALREGQIEVASSSVRSGGLAVRIVARCAAEGEGEGEGDMWIGLGGTGVQELRRRLGEDGLAARLLGGEEGAQGIVRLVAVLLRGAGERQR
jgi:hypothetical protein